MIIVKCVSQANIQKRKVKEIHKWKEIRKCKSVAERASVFEPILAKTAQYIYDAIQCHNWQYST